jgi:hypothetical protein
MFGEIGHGSGYSMVLDLPHCVVGGFNMFQELFILNHVLGQ